jgi:small GTP-binding protein
MRDCGRVACKIVLLGNSGVGKTCLVLRWVNREFTRTARPTVGANHKRKTIEISGGPVDVCLWDTAGQEHFRALAPLYAHAAATAILVVTIDDRETFLGIDTWIGLLEQSCDIVPPVLLLVNKMDCADSHVLSPEQIRADYTERFQSIFFVSANTGEGVDDAFMAAGALAHRFAVEKVMFERPAATVAAEPEETNCC